MLLLLVATIVFGAELRIWRQVRRELPSFQQRVAARQVRQGVAVERVESVRRAQTAAGRTATHGAYHVQPLHVEPAAIDETLFCVRAKQEIQTHTHTNRKPNQRAQEACVSFCKTAHKKWFEFMCGNNPADSTDPATAVDPEAQMAGGSAVGAGSRASRGSGFGFSGWSVIGLVSAGGSGSNRVFISVRVAFVFETTGRPHSWFRSLRSASPNAGVSEVEGENCAKRAAGKHTQRLIHINRFRCEREGKKL
jgi:hypothetical protein